MTVIKTKESKREAAIRKTVIQGCNWAPLLFNVCKEQATNVSTEQAINECKGYCTGIEENGMRMHMVRFVDGTAIIA
jgi:hypothetical protein